MKKETKKSEKVAKVEKVDVDFAVGCVLASKVKGVKVPVLIYGGEAEGWKLCDEKNVALKTRFPTESLLKYGYAVIARVDINDITVNEPDYEVVAESVIADGVEKVAITKKSKKLKADEPEVAPALSESEKKEIAVKASLDTPWFVTHYLEGSVKVGGVVRMSVTGGSLLGLTSWVGLFPKDTPHGNMRVANNQYLWFTYMKSSEKFQLISAVIEVALNPKVTAGEYEFRAFTTDGKDGIETCASQSFTVEA